MAEITDIFDGTVSITTGTKAVTGVGTLWLSAGIQSGDMFGSDGYARARIDTVNSNTSITLKDNWRGPTLAAGSAYWIRYQADSSRYSALLGQVRKMLSQASVSALSALTGSANKLPYFIDPSTMALADFNAKGRDIAAAADSAAAYTALGIVPDAQLPNRISANSLSVTNLNTIAENGWYSHIAGATGQPISAFGVLSHLQFNSDAAIQVWYRAGNVSGETFTRRKVGGVWGSWAPGDTTSGTASGARWHKLPSGLLVQSGTAVATTDASGNQGITFPTGFSSSSSYQAIAFNGEGGINVMPSALTSAPWPTATGFAVTWRRITDGSLYASGSARANWIAIGT